MGGILKTCGPSLNYFIALFSHLWALCIGHGSRDLIFIAGDIHCGVTSVVTDKTTGLQINHFTTSPITNHVCDFFPDLRGDLNERFHFNHLPLGNDFRNYLDVEIQFHEDSTNIQAKLVPVSTDIFENTEFKWIRKVVIVLHILKKVEQFFFEKLCYTIK